MKNKKLFRLPPCFSFILFFTLFGCSESSDVLSPEPGPVPGPTARTLNVTLTYNGAWTVSSLHPVKVVLFDNANLLGSPLFIGNLEIPSGMVQFKGIENSPVYLLTFLDILNNGTQAGGTPYVIYRSNAAVPASPIPIEAGATADLVMSFGDDNTYSATQSFVVWDHNGVLKNYSANSRAMYDGFGTVVVGSNADSTFLTIYFRGNSTGTYETAGNDLQMDYYTGSDYYNASSDGGTGTLTVVRYGAVGGYIAGSFSGVLTNWDTSTSYRIDNGTFYVKRGPNQMPQ